jgi:HEAT repeat protein
LLRAWKELPKAGRDSMDLQTASELTAQLAALGPEHLGALIDVIADPQGGAVAKVMAVICLTPYAGPDFVPRLMPLTETGQEVTTRACAINLLSLLPQPEVQDRLRALADDPERRVRLEALTALIKQGDTQPAARLDTFWKDPETTPQEREHMVLTVPESAAASYLSVFNEAVVDGSLAPAARRQAAKMLGRFGDASALDALRTCAENDPDPDLRALAQSGVEAIQSRTGGGAAPNP